MSSRTRSSRKCLPCSKFTTARPVHRAVGSQSCWPRGSLRPQGRVRDEGQAAWPLWLQASGHQDQGFLRPLRCHFALPSREEERRNQTSLQLPGSSFNFIRIPRLFCRLCFDRSQDQEIQARGTSWAVNRPVVPPLIPEKVRAGGGSEPCEELRGRRPWALPQLAADQVAPPFTRAPGWRGEEQGSQAVRPPGPHTLSGPHAQIWGGWEGDLLRTVGGSF